ncbi:hypothetical protein [Nitrospira lenta]|uniref:hypothetical protein n=1 Tax=Nitrospira lenta TaxID=1436998 RepID=UPI0011B6465A|nr:hypothetical protein [Nitrospira lenta]
MTGPTPCGYGCGAVLPVGTNRGKPRRFLTESHRRRWWSQARHQGAVRLRARAPRPSRQPRERWINFLALAPFDRRRLLEVLLAQGERVTTTNP